MTKKIGLNELVENDLEKLGKGSKHLAPGNGRENRTSLILRQRGGAQKQLLSPTTEKWDRASPYSYLKRIAHCTRGKPPRREENKRVVGHI